MLQDLLSDVILEKDKPMGKTTVLPTLYSRSSSGSIQEWTVEVNGDRYRTVAGQRGGNLTTSKWSVCIGKNSGRANVTSDDAQALAEAKAKWKKKKKSGAFEHIADVDNETFIKPMLAQTWQKLKNKPIYPLYVQYKFNGMRCIISCKGMFTRKGETIISAPHIWAALEDLFIVQPNLVLDGELYNHTLGEQLNRIIKLVRKTKNVDAFTLAESARLIKFYSYDAYNIDGLSEAAPFLQRRQATVNLLKDIPEIYLTETIEVKSDAELDVFFDKCKVLKYEGEMIRVNGPYEHKRSKYLIKRKDFIDEEFEIVAVNEGSGNASGMAATFTCKLETGETFDTNLKGPDSLMIEVLAHPEKYIGQMITVVFQQYSEYGIPQFPYADPSVLRDYE